MTRTPTPIRPEAPDVADAVLAPVRALLAAKDAELAALRTELREARAASGGNPGRLLTIKEAAALASMSEDTLGPLLHRDAPQSGLVKVGSLWRVHLDTFDAWQRGLDATRVVTQRPTGRLTRRA